MPPPLGALPGFRDFYPAECAERAYITSVWRDIGRRFGFLEYDGPPLEPLELYTRKSGDEIVGQLYAFTDKGGREVALRPEMTPTFARMVAARANALRKPVRWMSMPQLFRYERQQKGRLREHFQFNVDIVGEQDTGADAELLAVAIEVMRAFGLTAGDVRVRLSDRRILEAYLRSLGVADASLAAVYAVIDKLDRQPASVAEERLAAAGVSPSAIGAILQVPRVRIDEVEAALEGSDAVAHVRALRRCMSAVAALVGSEPWLTVDLSIVRGLAYYTGIVFELFDTGGEFRAICGGGRYDALLGALGGMELPALGFGMGDVVLGELLRARGLMPGAAPALDYWVVAGDGVSPDLVLQAAGALRRRGLAVEYVLNAERLATQKSRAQLQIAQKAGAQRALVVRGDGTAEIRTLRDAGAGDPLVRPLAELLAPGIGDPASLLQDR